MKKLMLSLMLSLVLVLVAGCASPAADYVRADKETWDQFDPTIDRWIDGEPTFSANKKDALHQLNVARRARVAHAIAAVGS